MKKIILSIMFLGMMIIVAQTANAQAPSSAYKICADEGKQCSYTGTGRVAYGANGKFEYKNVSRGLACTNAAFGRDPIPGTPKKCYVRLDDSQGRITSRPETNSIPRGSTVYTGCGYTYKYKEVRDTQCGSGGTSKWIGDGVDESKMTREQEVYTGCGYTYASKTERDKQCGSGGTSKWINDEVKEESTFVPTLREAIVYTGCGYTYKTKKARDTQCGSGGTSKWIGDGVDESKMTRGQTVYTGCGYTYASKNARDKQCGSGGTSKWIRE